MDRVHTTLDSPLGELTLVATPEGALTGLYVCEQRYLPESYTFGERDDEAFADVAQQLAEYFEGTRREFTVPVDPRGTPFQRAVWDELRGIPYGGTTTYGALAVRVGAPTAARAVGAANGRNPISLIVPCHRVLGSTGSLRGYASGMERKLWLLELEGAPLSRSSGGSR